MSKDPELRKHIRALLKGDDARESFRAVLRIVFEDIERSIGRVEAREHADSDRAVELAVQFVESKIQERRFLEQWVDADSPTRYLRTAAGHFARDFFRREVGHVASTASELELVADESPSTEERLDHDRLSAAFMTAFAKQRQPARQNLSTTLAHVLDMLDQDAHDLARARGVSQDALESELRARASWINETWSEWNESIAQFRFRAVVRKQHHLLRVRAILNKRPELSVDRVELSPERRKELLSSSSARESASVAELESLADALEAELVSAREEHSRRRAEYDETFGSNFGLPKSPRWNEVAFILGRVTQESSAAQLKTAENTVTQQFKRARAALALALQSLRNEP